MAESVVKSSFPSQVRLPNPTALRKGFARLWTNHENSPAQRAPVSIPALLNRDGYANKYVLDQLESRMSLRLLLLFGAIRQSDPNLK